MKSLDPRFRLAWLIALTWSFVVVLDAFSESYAIDTGLHIGCGTILGVILGTAAFHKKNGGDE